MIVLQFQTLQLLPLYCLIISIYSPWSFLLPLLCTGRIMDATNARIPNNPVMTVSYKKKYEYHILRMLKFHFTT